MFEDAQENFANSNQIYVGASALQARLVPSWSKLIFSMRDNVECNVELTDTDKSECQNALFGLVKIEEGLLQKLDKEAKLTKTPIRIQAHCK